MLMLCYFYCIPFAKFMYFASSLLLLILSMFMLKRGAYSHRPKLRQASFFMMFIAAFKAFVVDVRLGEEYFLCEYAVKRGWNIPCSNAAMTTSEFSGLVLFVLSSFLILYCYKLYMPERKLELVSPDEINLAAWTRLALWGVIAMICWLAAPWVGYLTVGHVPKIFTVVQWQHFAILNFALLMNGFWKSEACIWNFDNSKRSKMRHLNNTWTPKDSLWLSVFLYLIALALSYVSHDVLTLHDRVEIME